MQLKEILAGGKAKRFIRQTVDRQSGPPSVGRFVYLVVVRNGASDQVNQALGNSILEIH